MLYRVVCLVVAFALVSWVLPVSLSAAAEEPLKPLRAGIIGLDTSHVVAFTKLLNAATPKPEVAGVRVVAAYPGGSPDIPSSRDRVAGYTKELRDKFGVTIVGSIDELLAQVDVVLLESVDGRPHLEQARPVFKAQQAGVHRQAGRRHAGRRDRHLRPGPGDEHAVFLELVASLQPGDRGDAASPQGGRRARLRRLWPLLISKSITPTCSGTASTASRRCSPSWAPAASRFLARRPRGPSWSSGSGTAAGWGRSAASAQGHADYGATVFGTKGIAPSGGYGGYEPLVVEIVKFFKTGKPPVSAEETIEIFAFMEAADESKRQGGKPVTIESVMTKARSQLAK